MVTDSKPIKPWYRRLAFRMSIRGLIVLVLIVGGTLGWLGHRARVQREAVAAIKRPGVFINYDWEYHDGILDPRAICPWPKWLVDTVGIDYLSSVTQVQIYSPVGQVRATDADLLQIGKLSRLESLWLKGNQITEAGFASVAGLSRVNQLVIELYGIKGGVAEASVKVIPARGSPARLHLDAGRRSSISFWPDPIKEAGYLSSDRN